MEARFFNRELSWLEFNDRILSLALRKELPLMERLNYLSIVSSNFDEFFQVRVACVKRMAFENPKFIDSSGLSPKILLASISARSHQIIRREQDCLLSDILPALAKKGLVYVSPESYSISQMEYLSNIFRSEIFPLLTPLRTDSEVFPHIKNLSTYVAFLLEPIPGIKNSLPEFLGKEELENIALVEIPEGIPNVYYLSSEKKNSVQFALLQDIITLCGTNLFPGFAVAEAMLFKVSRDADFAVDEDSNNFINAMENVLIQRKSSFAVQMTCNKTSEKIKNLLMEKLSLDEDDVYYAERILNPGTLLELRETETAQKLSYEKWEHFYPNDFLENEPFWDSIRSKDKILHVPYESYEPVVKFLRDAAEDENVLAIKMTLYRTGRNSPIIEALERAARNGKHVTVLVELKARFDEERNIAWANELEQSGVTVIYGLANLKVHAKIMMILRRENDTIRRYVHLSTGNYNTKTAKLYSDISLFTANQQIANDATQFFNLVTGYSTLQKMDCLGMAPVTMKARIISMIQREAERSTAEQPGLIMAKMNSLTQEDVIEALYKASSAGVKILLNIRGICMLVPGVPNLSENIQVISIVDRYLEHSRIFYFQNALSPELYCSSADWMTRNLDRRIELMFPILDKDLFEEMKTMLEMYFKDNTNAMELSSSGNWSLISKDKKTSSANFEVQNELYKKYKRLNDIKKQNLEKQFEVRRKN